MPRAAWRETCFPVDVRNGHFKDFDEKQIKVKKTALAFGSMDVHSITACVAATQHEPVPVGKGFKHMKIAEDQ